MVYARMGGRSGGGLLFPAICQGSELTWALMMISGRIREVVFGCGTYDVVVVLAVIVVMKL